MSITNRTTDRRAENRLVVRNDSAVSSEPLPGDFDEYTMGLPTCHDRGIIVQLYHLADGELKTLNGRLFDLSPSGAKLAVNTRIPLGDAVGLCIQFDDAEVEIATAGSVCWVGHIPDGKLLIGCALAEPIPNSVFQEISDSGYLERRQTVRHKIDLHTRVKRREKSAKTLDVRLDNYSVGGFCMFAPEGFTPNEHLLLEIQCDGESCVHIPAEVRWQKSCKFGFSIGCRFVTENGFDVFQNAMQHHISIDESVEGAVAEIPAKRTSTDAILKRIKSLVGRLLGRKKCDKLPSPPIAE